MKPIRIFDTFIYFVCWGFFWGLFLGGLAGTQIFPVFGTMYSTIWGVGMGIACGFLAAIIALATFPRLVPGDQVTFHRRRLTLLIGVITAIAAPLILLATSNGFLWGSYDNSLNVYLVASMFTACLYGGLSAANATGYFVDDRTGIVSELEEFGSIRTTGMYFATKAATWWVFALSIIGTSGIALANAAMRSTNTTNPYEVARYYEAADYVRIFIEYGLVGAFGALAVIILVSLMLGTIIGSLNRLYFMEYQSHWSLERYRGVIMVLTFVFTLAGTAMAFLFGFAIPALLTTIYATYLARGYADQYYAAQGKTKRKEKPKMEPIDEWETDPA